MKIYKIKNKLTQKEKKIIIIIILTHLLKISLFPSYFFYFSIQFRKILYFQKKKQTINILINNTVFKKFPLAKQLILLSFLSLTILILYVS